MLLREQTRSAPGVGTTRPELKSISCPGWVEHLEQNTIERLMLYDDLNVRPLESKNPRS
jgi:hypothetical protein